MAINLDEEWRLGILYSSDIATTTDFINRVFRYICENKIHATVIDSNHIITPDMLVGFSDECIKNIILIKPSSISSIGYILDNIITSREIDDTMLIITSLFIQLPYDSWSVYNYDPLFILYGLKNKLKKTDRLKVIVTIDKQRDEKGIISYWDIVNDIADWILSGFRKNNKIIIKRIK